MPKMNVKLFATKVYENITTLKPQKNKPNQTQSLAPLIRVLPAPESFHRGFILRGPVPLVRVLYTLMVPAPQTSPLAHKKTEKYEKLVRNA